jgi:hypothetical protein
MGQAVEGDGYGVHRRGVSGERERYATRRAILTGRAIVLRCWVSVQSGSESKNRSNLISLLSPLPPYLGRKTGWMF